MGRARTLKADHQEAFHIEGNASLRVCAASCRVELPWERARPPARARQAGRCSTRRKQVSALVGLVAWADRATGFVVFRFATPPPAVPFIWPWGGVA